MSIVAKRSPISATVDLLLFAAVDAGLRSSLIDLLLVEEKHEEETCSNSLHVVAERHIDHNFGLENSVFGRPFVKRFALCYNRDSLPPIFGTSVVAKRLDGLRCHLYECISYKKRFDV